MDRTDRRARGFRPASEALEPRVALTRGPLAPGVELVHIGIFGLLGAQLARPNTPVAPYGATKNATFIDPSAAIVAGNNVVVGAKDYVAPWATLNARRGTIEIGSGSTIQDNATLIGGTTGPAGRSGIVVGDNVLIAAGATVIGPATVGGPGGANTQVGPNATVDGAIIEPGAAVGALAFVGPGVVIPSGFEVRPGAVVTSNAQLLDTSLIVPYSAGADASTAAALADSASLAVAYANLYQGQSATGTSPLAHSPGVYNGDLTVVEGASPSPGFSFTTGSNGSNGSGGSGGANGTNGASATGAPVTGTTGRPITGTNGLPVTSSSGGTGSGTSLNGTKTFGTGTGTGLASGIGTVRQNGTDTTGTGTGTGTGLASGIGTARTTAINEASPKFYNPLHGRYTPPAFRYTGLGTPYFPARVIGNVTFTAGPLAIRRGLGLHDSIRFDEDQPGLIAPFARLGRAVTIHPRRGGSIAIGSGLTTGDRVVLTAGASASLAIGQGVSIGDGSVIDGSIIGAGTSIGPDSYIKNTIVPPGILVPAGTILIDGKSGG